MGRRYSVYVPPEMREAMNQGGVLAPRVSRELALQVPAVLRSRNLIASSLSALPLRVHGPDRKIVTDVQYLVGSQIDPDIVNSVVMAMTLEDMLFEGYSWWRVTRFGWHGYPVEARHVPFESVHVAQLGTLLPSMMRITPDTPFPAEGQVYIDGRPVDDRELIRFDSPNPPLLTHAARAIRTCLALDTAVALYAKDPLPLGYFAPADGVTDPATDAQIQGLLDDWEAARGKRAWGYVPAAVKAQTLQWNPEQLQLADQRQHAVLEIARAAGVDAEELGVSTTSRTYQNEEQRDQRFLKYTLSPYVTAVEERLTMRDVLPRGYKSRIDLTGFLRPDTLARMEIYQLGRQVGAYNDERIAELEDIPSAHPDPGAGPPITVQAPKPPIQREHSVVDVDAVTP